MKFSQSCLTLCDPMDYSLPGFFVTPWTVAHQALLFMKFTRQEYWNGLPFPSPGDVQSHRLSPCFLCFLHWQAGSLPLVAPGKPYLSIEAIFNLILVSSALIE